MLVVAEDRCSSRGCCWLVSLMSEVAAVDVVRNASMVSGSTSLCWPREP